MHYIITGFHMASLSHILSVYHTKRLTYSEANIPPYTYGMITDITYTVRLAWERNV